MRKIFLSISILLFIIAVANQKSFAQSAPYTPAKGSTERKAILDGVRKYRKAPGEVYTPTEFNVQNGWAFVLAEDPNEPGVDTAAFFVLLQKTKNVWKVVDEINNTEGTDYDKEIKRIRKRFPKVPAGIFP